MPSDWKSRLKPLPSPPRRLIPPSSDEEAITWLWETLDYHGSVDEVIWHNTRLLIEEGVKDEVAKEVAKRLHAAELNRKTVEINLNTGAGIAASGGFLGLAWLLWQVIAWLFLGGDPPTMPGSGG